MKTVVDLGALVKRKYPEYEDMTDLEVGQKVKALHPADYSDFQDLTQKSLALLKHYDPKLGRFKAWWRALKSGTRGNLQAKLTAELRSIIEQGVALEDAALGSQRKRAELENLIVSYEHQLYQLRIYENLLDQAAQKGMTVETYQETHLNQLRSELVIQEQESFANNRIREQRGATLNQIELERELSHIRLTEFREKEATQLNNELKKMNEQVRLALIAKALSSHQRIMLVQELLDGLYKQVEEIEHSSLKPATKQRMIEDRESIITNFKGYRDAEGSRLL
jgi:hypothetical protein